MKKNIIFLLAILLTVDGCAVKDTPAVSTLQSNNLKSSFIKIKAGNAYTLQTPNGAVLRIGKNTFSKNNEDEVVLEIKEAYTLNDILKAGLVTESDGKLLYSGGMIYINATINGKQAKVFKPFKASIPTNSYDENMQLYKGEITADSSINWTAPEPLDTTSELRNRLVLGRNLFKANCSNCHKPTKDFTGPALAKVRARAPYPEWPYLFTVNPIKMITTDSYSKSFYEKWKSNGVMTAFPTLKKEEVKAIFDYCDNEAALNLFPLPEAQANTVQADSSNPAPAVPCVTTDTIYYKKVDTAIKPIIYTGNEAIPPYEAPSALSTEQPKKAEDYEGLRNGFTDPNTTNGMYDFEVKTLGWYNVDAEVEGYNGSSLISLQVKVSSENKTLTAPHIYVFCPDKKMLSVANDFDGEKHSFNKINGKVPLFLNDKAVVIAFTSQGKELWYGISSFKVQLQQTISVQLKQSTPDEFKSLIEKNKIDGIELDVFKKEDIEIIKKPCNEITGADTAIIVPFEK